MSTKVFKIPAIAVLLIVCSPAHVLAQSPGSVPVIVVTPTRISMPLLQSSVPVEVISRQQIETSASSDVAQIIQQYAGLEVARNGDYGKVTSLFTRGSDSNQTVILIDGVKINPATIGAPALQNISPEIIERIEIVKGPRSSVYGSEAIGGVVNIITRQQVTGLCSSLSLGAGQNESRKAVLDMAYGTASQSFGVTLDQFDSEGFPVTDLSNEDHGYDNRSVNAFYTFKTNHQHLNFRHWQSKGNVEYYYFGEQDQDYENSASAMQWDLDINSELRTSLRVSQITDDIQQNVANYLSDFDQALTTRNEVDAKLDYHINDRSVVSVGLLKAEEDVNALSFGTQIDELTDIDESYALFQSNHNHHRYSVALRHTHHEDFGKKNTWNVDYQVQLDKGIRLYSGLGTAFRAPDHSDRFGSIGNPDLDPETSKNIELSLIIDLSVQSQFQFSLFKNTIEDLIEPNGSFTQMVNIDEAEINGVELSYRNQHTNWSYRFNALLQDPQNKTSGEMLSRRAQSRLNIHLGYTQPAWQLAVSSSIVSSRDDSPFSDITLPQYEVLDVSGYYQLSRQSRLSAKLDNLFNEQYETAAGFNTLDRNLMVTFKYQFAN